MVKFILGKPNSGKSLAAEELARSCGGPYIYLATMKVMDEDGERRVIKHRAQREGKGFITIEHPYALREVPDKIIKITGSDTPAGDKRIKATVLLECLANLVGNELYDNPLRPWSQDPLGADKDGFANIIIEDIIYLADRVSDLIIVSSEFKADEGADKATRLYIELLDKINLELSLRTGNPLFSPFC